MSSMSGREDDIRTPPPLSQDTPPQPWTPPAYFGPEPASRSGITVDVNPSTSAPGYAKLPRVDGRYGRGKRYGHGSPVLGPVFLIAAGVVFLLNNTGILPWSIWGNLWRLWPLALVAIGLDMLFGRRNALVSLVIVLGVLGAGAGILFYTGGFGDTRIASLPLSVAMPQGITAAQVNIELKDTNLTLGSLPSESQQLASGTLEYYDRQGEPIHILKIGDPNVELRLDEQNQHDFSFSNFANSAHQWDVRLNREVPTILLVNTGDANSMLDLTNLHLTRIDFHGGDGNLTLNVPQGAGGVTGQLDLGDGNINLVVPVSLAAHISIDKGDGNVNTDTAFKKQGNIYTSLGGDAKNNLDLSIKMGDGNINIKSK